MDLSDDAVKLWDAARALARAAAAVSLPPLLFMTDPDRTPLPWRTAQALPAGAGVVHRHFGAPDAEQTALRLREATRQAGVVLMIGADADLAERVGADGVHLPERALDQAPALRRRRPDWLLTGAVHSLHTLLAAPPELDALILSPVFPAGGASAARDALGVDAFTDAVRQARRPVYALGGIDASTVAALTGSGACGIAGVGAVRDAFVSKT